MQQRNVVLLITHSGDFFTIDRVAAALSKHGVQPFRLDTDKFPMHVQLSAYFSNDGLEHRLQSGENAITTEQVKAVWMRRLWQPQLSELAPQFQESCVRESMATLQGFLDNLSEVRWIDKLSRIVEAENKLRQLRLAKNVGLQIPQTLVTNDPQQAREFFSQLQGKVVAKLLTPLSTGMKSSAFFVYTSAVQAKDLVDAESLRYCPMVFQAQIPKKRELRVIFVAGNFFVGGVDASCYNATTMDWRQATSEAFAWELDKLPNHVADNLRSLMAQLQLNFGAIDLIQTPNDEYIFLEVNPTGEWGMLERDLNLPIAAAIADALIG